MALGMTNYELAQLGMQGASGLFQGIAANRQKKMSKEELAMQYRLAAMQNMQNVVRAQGDQRQDRALQFADRSPLGAEQNYILKQQIRNAILPQLMKSVNSGGPTDPSIRGTFTSPTSPLSGMDLSGIMGAISPQATGRAVTDRRNALAAIDPSSAAYFGSLDEYGLNGSTSGLDYQTQMRTQERQAELDETDYQLRSLAMQQYNLTEQQAQEMEKKGGSGFWKKLAKIGIIAGGAALMATGVGGPAGAMIIGAATGAGSGAIDGGWKGALLGAGLGAATGGLGGGGAQAGLGAARTAGATTSQLVRESILNPRTIGQMVGAGVGGRTGAMIGLGSNFMPGPNYSRFGVPNAGFEGNNPNILPGNPTIDTTSPVAPPNFQAGLPPQLQQQLRSIGPTAGNRVSGGVGQPRQNFVTPQDLNLAGGGRPNSLQLPPASVQQGNIPDPRLQLLFGSGGNQNRLQQFGLQNQQGVSGGMPAPPWGAGINAGSRALTGQVMPPSSNPIQQAILNQPRQLGMPNQRMLPSGPTNQALPAGPRQPLQLPRGQYNMPQNQNPPNIPLGPSSVNTNAIQSLQQLLGRLSGPERQQVLRQLIMRSGGQ